MSDRTLLELYSKRLLALASSIPHAGRLTDPDGTARRRSPLCGSWVQVDVSMEDGRVSGFAQDVRACALGQAAAAVVGQAIVGRTPEEVGAGRDALWAMLREDGPVPVAPWDGLDALMAARDHPNRHASIMLAFDATLDAIANARKMAAAQR